MDVRSLFWAVMIAVACGGSSFCCDPAWSQNASPSAEEITRALTPPAAPLTRSFRGVEVQRPQSPPSIDLYVNFRFNSAELDPDSLTTLNALATALRTPQLRGSVIEILGHTDGVGSMEYNQSLSEQRADAVKQYLIRAHSLPAERLRAFGRGKTQLKNPQDPTAGINRRVEVRNLTALSN